MSYRVNNGRAATDRGRVFTLSLYARQETLTTCLFSRYLCAKLVRSDA